MGVGHRSVTSGLLVSLEGLDGVGKTTQIARLKEWLEGQVAEVMTVREPGGTALGEALREVVLHRAEAGSAIAEFLVFAAARAELIETVVLPVLSRQGAVLMDRFIDSSVAYQAFGRGLDPQTILEINAIVTQGRTPNLTIWLKGEPFPSGEADRLEQRDQEYFRRVESGYAWLADREPERWLILESRQDPDVIFDAICRRIDIVLQGMKGGE